MPDLCSVARACLCVSPSCSRPSIVSTAEFEADKASLLRMLAEFQRDHPQAAAALAALASDTTDSISNSSSNGNSSRAGVVDLDPQALDTANIDAVNKGMQVCAGRAGVRRKELTVFLWLWGAPYTTGAAAALG